MGIAQALVNSPDLVFLDEPMSGLDPIGRRLVRELILDLKGAGKTVFFSTHILSDAETLCDRVALLRGGRLVAVGRLADILHIDITHMEILVTGIEESALDSLPPGSEKRRTGERWILHIPEGQLGTVVRALEAAGGRILSVQPVRQSLEEYFFKEMGAPTEWDLAD
jgi:ABC-2 type transport system ATP-binding protein